MHIPSPRRAAAAGILAAASLAIAACGSSSVTSATILNTETVERAIEHSSQVQRNKAVHVSCPSGVHQKKGLVFDCVATGKGGSTRFVVTQLDNAGRVHYQAA
jgi:hypothetical protein